MIFDPAGHIKISVSSIRKSKEFYKKLFGKLGFEQILDESEAAGWKTLQEFGIWIEQAGNPDYKYKFSAPGIHHLCFKSRSIEEVDKIHDFMAEQKIHIFDKPQHYPEYTENYYAVFFDDPDGIKLEVAFY